MTNDGKPDPDRQLTKEEIEFGLTEIRDMRQEINWRVKVAYNSSLIFLSVIAFALGTLFDAGNSFLEVLTADQDLRVQVGLILVLLVSAWVGVQNANHIIEKRIELYTLTVLRTLTERSPSTYFGWIGYLYGSKFFGNNTLNASAKVLNASIGLFIYFLPNALAIAAWVYLLTQGVAKHVIFFGIATTFLVVAFGTSALLFFYVLKLNKKSTAFYKQHMLALFSKTDSD